MTKLIGKSGNDWSMAPEGALWIDIAHTYSNGKWKGQHIWVREEQGWWDSNTGYISHFNNDWGTSRYISKEDDLAGAIQSPQYKSFAEVPVGWFVIDSESCCPLFKKSDEFLIDMVYCEQYYAEHESIVAYSQTYDGSYIPFAKEKPNKGVIAQIDSLEKTIKEAQYKLTKLREKVI